MIYQTKLNLQLFNCFCSCQLIKAHHVQNRLKSSHEWLERQKRDPYVEKAKIEKYRCRSAYKLLEMNERYKFFYPGQYVVDIGAAPGSWSQVAVKAVNSIPTDTNKSTGRVVSIDLLPIYEIVGAMVLSKHDFTSPKTQDAVLERLKPRKPNLILSDMAPNASGIKSLDHENISMLALSVLRFALESSDIGATCIIKVWDGGQTRNFEKEMSKFYSNVKYVKPKSSRSDSSEVYLMARNFKGLAS